MTAPGALFSASLGDGSDAVMVVDLPRLPHDGVGILIGRPEGAARRPATALGRRSGAVVSSSSDVEWLGIQPQELTRTAVATARLVHIRFVVICPLGVSPARTGLACAVARVFQHYREPGSPIVMCAEVPPLGRGHAAIPHEVTVTADGVAHVRHVWEIVRHEDLPAWDEALKMRPIAA